MVAWTSVLRMSRRTSGEVPEAIKLGITAVWDEQGLASHGRPPEVVLSDMRARLMFSPDSNSRILLWLTALGLTAAILSYPVDLQLAGSPMQSTESIRALNLFGALYYLWLLVLLALLLGSTEVPRHSERALVVILFTLVFWGFWIVKTYEGQVEELGFLANVKHLADTGRISLGTRNLYYFDFPGLSILAHALQSIAGLSYQHVRTVGVLSAAVLSALVLYCLHEIVTCVPGPGHATRYLVVPLIVQSSMLLSVQFFFRPESTLALNLFLTVLILAVHDKYLRNSSWHLALGLLLLGALTITHFMTSVAMVFVLSGIYLARIAPANRGNIRGAIVLLLAMVIGWQLYYAIRTLDVILGLATRLTSLIDAGTALAYVTTLARANLAEEIPLWARMVRLFWLIGVYLVASVLAVWNLARLNDLSRFDRISTLGLASVALMSALSAVLSATGVQASRYLQYGSFFAAPLLLSHLARVKQQRLLLKTVVPAFLLLSLPSFFAFHGQISTRTLYPSEGRGAEFLSSRVADRDNVNVYTGARELNYYVFYFPNTVIRTPPRVAEDPNLLTASDVPVFWNATDALLSEFSAHPLGDSDEGRVFVFSKAFLLTYRHLLGIPVDDPRWTTVQVRLNSANLFYSNGQVWSYIR